jgi:cytochrome c553
MTHPARLPFALALLLSTSFMGALPVLAQQPNRALILECMACHGDDGVAKDKDIPHLAGQNYEYLLKQMRDFQKGRRPHKEMRVMSRLMDDAEMQEIADFYARLPR